MAIRPRRPLPTRMRFDGQRKISTRAMMLIRTYRVRGHLAAKLDPLRGLDRRTCRPSDPANHGFGPNDLDRPIFVGGALVFRAGDSPRDREGLAGELLRRGRRRIHAHQRPGGARFSRSGSRARTPRSSSHPTGKWSILTKVIEAEQWEKFLARKYVGTKNLGLDGGESAVPALEAVIKYGGQYGVTRSTSAWPTAAGSTFSRT